MTIIGFVIFGLVVGLLARALMPGRDSMGLGMTLVLGVIGAVAAGWIGRSFGWYGENDAAGFVSSTIGAIIVLAIYNAVVRKRAPGARAERNFPRRAA